MAVKTGLRLSEGDHVVKFYDDERDLVSTVTEHVGAALASDETVIVIANDEHRTAFQAALRSSGVDVERAESEEHLLLVDAAELLARFVHDGVPSRGAFDAVVGSLVRTTASRGRVVRAYGEMVTLLWERGDVLGAIELEQMWNELSSTVAFSLLCAYPAWMMEPFELSEAFGDVCGAHTAIVAGAPTLEGAERTRRFVRSLDAPSRARRLVHETLEAWGLAELSPVSTLIVSELAANAYVHSHAGCAVSLSRTHHGIRIAVGDVDPAPPVARASSGEATSGRGLQLVATLSSDWGWTKVEGGKLVWADVCRI